MDSDNNIRVLVVDDVLMTVEMVVKDLQEGCEVLTAYSGEEGFKLLLEYKDKIDIIILDIILPQMSGFEFMDNMKKHALDEIPVIIMTANEQPQLEIKALKNGAADFIRKPLYPEILRNRIHNVLMRHQMEYDVLTRLYNRNKTFSSIRDMVKDNPDERYAFVRFDIDNFSLYNASMTEQEGNNLLLYSATLVQRMAREYKQSVYGRVDADIFCMCFEYDQFLLEQQIKKATEFIFNYRKDYRIESSIGICIFDGGDVGVERVFTKASLAARTCKGIYNKHYAYFEDWMEGNLAQEQEVINEMVEALEDNQFVPYIQPKYSLDTNEPCGGEALVRWIHPTKGMISPGKFIPVFEKNGFIAKLDYYMWEEVCKLLKKWKNAKSQVYPISVNISRISMYNPQLTKLLLELIDKYGLTPDLLQLEITESAYMSNPDLMKQTIVTLQKEGFTILMDDFGSGYSSLNTLKEIQVDILKVDMKFLPQGDSVERSEKILSSVIRMAGWLGIPTIAEGVETKGQRDFLRDIGCDYVQGFYYAKPLPISEFEQLISNSNGIVKKDSIVKYSSAVWSADEKINELLSSMQLPVLIIEYSSSRVDVVRVNSIFNSMFGKDFRDNLEESDRKEIYNVFSMAVKDGVADGEFAYQLPLGKVRYYQLKVKRLEKITSATLLCAIIIDITEQIVYRNQLSKLDKILPNNNRTKILVIDDSKFMRRIISSIFSESYDIYEAENGKEGLEILQEHKDSISMILLDMIMPEMDGLTFLSEKNKLEDVDNISVMVMSGEGDVELQLNMLAFGVIDYVTKPFDNRIFKQKVDNAIMYSKRFTKIKNEYEKMIAEEME